MKIQPVSYIPVIGKLTRYQLSTGPHLPAGHFSFAHDSLLTNCFSRTTGHPHWRQARPSKNSHVWQMANRASICSWVQRGIPAATCAAAEVAKLAAFWMRLGGAPPEEPHGRSRITPPSRYCSVHGIS